jgi:ABC-type glycerol-3-phosphate transport system substrate-binding protein
MGSAGRGDEAARSGSAMKAGRVVWTGPAPAAPRRVFLAAGAAAPLLAACAGGPDRAPPAGDAEVSGRVTHWSIPQFPFQEDVGAELAGEFRARHPRIEYVPETVTGNRVTALVTAAAAGTAPDIGMAGSYQTQELAATGIARPLDDHFKASRVVKPADLWPALVRDMTYKGKQYGMPFGPDVRVMYANTSVMEGAGLPAARPAQTWDELEEHIRRVYRPGAGQAPRLGFPPFWGSGGQQLWQVPFWQLGGEALSPDNERVTIDGEPGIRALEWLKRVFDLQDGWAAVEEARRGDTNANKHFLNGTMAYYFATFTERKSPEFLANPQARFAFTPWPLPPGGRRVNYGGCHTWVLTTQATAPDSAWRFMEFLADEANNLRFAVRYDRIPIRIKTAESAAYQQNDPFLRLAVEEMRHRRFVIPVPGSNELSTLTQTIPVDVVSGKKSARDALREAAAQMQQVIDQWKR